MFSDFGSLELILSFTFFAVTHLTSSTWACACFSAVRQAGTLRILYRGGRRYFPSPLSLGTDFPLSPMPCFLHLSLSAERRVFFVARKHAADRLDLTAVSLFFLVVPSTADAFEIVDCFVLRLFGQGVHRFTIPRFGRVSGSPCVSF